MSQRMPTTPKPWTPSLTRQHRLLWLVDFANKMKIRFRYSDDVFATFCETCILCEENGEEWVFAKLRHLFADHQDLIAELAELQSEGSGLIDDIKGFDHQEAFRGLRNGLAAPNTHEKPEMKNEGPRNYVVAPVKSAQNRVIFYCEDDMCDLDVMIGLARSAMSRIGIHMAARRTEGCLLTAGELRCIERMYGDRGADMVALVKKNTAQVLPLVLSRLQQKHDQWVAYRSDARKVWKQVFAEHRRPSLGRKDTDTVIVEAPAYDGSSRLCPTVEAEGEAPVTLGQNVGAVKEELGQLEARNKQNRVPRSCSVYQWPGEDGKQIKGSVWPLQFF